MVDASTVLKVLLVSVGAALFTETVMYLWCYKRSSFRSLNEQIDKASKQLDTLKSLSISQRRSMGKKAERLENMFKREAAKEIAVLRLKQTLVVCMCPVLAEVAAGCCNQAGPLQ